MSKSPGDHEDTGDAEFERVLKNLVNTPHKPHEKAKPKRSGQKKPAEG